MCSTVSEDGTWYIHNKVNSHVYKNKEIKAQQDALQ